MNTTKESDLKIVEDRLTEKIITWMENESFSISGINEVLSILKDQENVSSETEKVLIGYFQAIRWESFASFMMEQIPTCKSQGIRAMLLRSCWENGSDFSAYTEPLIKIVLFSSFEEALEASSILDTIEMNLLETEQIDAGINLILENLNAIDEKRKVFAKQLIEILQP